MMIFFELLKKRIGYSRIGRISINHPNKKYLSSPSIILPINNTLLNQINFIKQFEDHDLFICNDENFLKKNYLIEKFQSANLIYTHKGTLDEFQQIISKNQQEIIKNNILIIIPFNIPTTVINKDFAIKEIENYLKEVSIILKNNSKIIFGLTCRVFEFFELFDLYYKIIYKFKNLKILNLADLFDNFSKFREIIREIITIKQNSDNNLVLMASGRIIPKYFPILIYLGIDLIDSSFMLYLSSENFYNTIEYLLPIYKIKYLPCSCIACRGNLKHLLKEKYSSKKIELLCLHNLISAKIYMNKILQYLNHEDFRVFVEKTTLDETNLISMLRILDKKYFEIIRYETPIIQKKKKINCLGASSYYRPDFQEFRNRTIHTFEPEVNTRVIILFPCSAVKPYSESKSHKKFLSILRKFPEFPDFQEIILTSPLGAIPRQLENIYPVNSYDIPVTGEWDEEELNITSNMLIKLLEKYDSNIPIVCHLEHVYLEIINRAKKKVKHQFFVSNIDKTITSHESLQSLKSLISISIKKFNLNLEDSYYSALKNSWERKLLKILDYQYGIGSGLKVFKNGIKLRKNRNRNQIEIQDLKNNATLGVFKYDTGQINLTIKGASLLNPISKNEKTITFDGDEISGNTLFRAGILDYNSNLLPNESVLILNRNKEKIIGMGHLIIGSNIIKNTKTGRVVILYELMK